MSLTATANQGWQSPLGSAEAAAAVVRFEGNTGQRLLGAQLPAVLAAQSVARSGTSASGQGRFGVRQ
jgi:hypothetical protein